MKNRFEQMREQSKNKIEVVTAPLLYPTPPAIAARMVELLDIEPDQSILEPSAGSGSLIDAIKGVRVFITAVEIEYNLYNRLRGHHGISHLIHDDFLNLTTKTIESQGKFDRIIMNPPFNGGADIKHISHALQFLKPGGTLVAICANGPRQNAKLKPMAHHWERLESGTFKDAGTMVESVIMVYKG